MQKKKPSRTFNRRTVGTPKTSGRATQDKTNTVRRHLAEANVRGMPRRADRPRTGSPSRPKEIPPQRRRSVNASGQPLCAQLHRRGMPCQDCPCSKRLTASAHVAQLVRPTTHVHSNNVMQRRGECFDPSVYVYWCFQAGPFDIHSHGAIEGERDNARPARKGFAAPQLHPVPAGGGLRLCVRPWHAKLDA